MALEDIVRDLAAEHDELDALVAPLDEVGWSAPTPAEGWAVRDEICHLGYFDEVAALAATKPDEFRALAERARRSSSAFADHLERGRTSTGAELLAWWRGARADLLGTLRTIDPRRRIPWFGPDMSPASFTTARLMETWAHGVDVYDALGVVKPATDRLKHVCHIGVFALPWSFAVRKLEQPPGTLRAELASPSGAVWTWGPDGATDVIRGEAMEFALLATQRRHRADTSLQADGMLADAFLNVAQAFAGPPGPGRQPLTSLP
jgi:uncharacterized protein (TIGR03084 family)